MPEGATTDVLQDQIGASIVELAGGEHIHDVWVAREPAQSDAFSLEADLDGLIIDGGVSDLDRDLTVDIRLAGQPNLAETTGADQLQWLDTSKFERGASNHRRINYPSGWAGRCSSGCQRG